MNKNFVVNQSVYLVNNNIFYDLHNDYKFSKINLVIEKKEVILIWVERNSDKIDKQSVRQITLQFKNVTYFQLSEGFVNEKVETIEEIGYKEPDDLDLDWLNFEGTQNDSQHIILRFQNDEYMRIYSETILFN